MEKIIGKSAILSPDRKYRYTLWRSWGGLFNKNNYVVFVLINPSVADEKRDDRTVKKCISYAKKWGYDSICIVNLFAYIAQDPNDMLSQIDPVGPENDLYLKRVAKTKQPIVAGWGTSGNHLKRDKAVKKIFKNLHYLELSVDKHPKHPLYLPGYLKPIPWGKK